MPRSQTQLQELEALKRKRSVTKVTDFHKLVKALPNRPAVISEGDSWFDFPGYNLIDHLEKKKRMNLLRLERNGEEVVTLMSGGQLSKLAKVIQKSPVDLILFSGGGNDVVGKYRIEMYLNEFTEGMGWMDCIHHERFNRKMDMVENAYRVLIDIVKNYSKNPDLKIVTHNYDKAIPDGRKAEFVLGLIKSGPWIQPFMKEKGIKDPVYQQAIVEYFLQQASDRFQRVADDHPEVLTLVNTFGTLQPTHADWSDELHPTKSGFKQLGDRMWHKINQML